MNLDLTVPKDVGIITESNIDGGKAELPRARGGTKGYLRIKVSADGGMIKIKEKSS
ncbi:MAG: hypothetical protein OWQ54_00380 [Sulfolobaceae archaeon]|nr:hypothetical protein [Sulfolobaceae archaeon]